MFETYVVAAGDDERVVASGSSEVVAAAPASIAAMANLLDTDTPIPDAAPAPAQPWFLFPTRPIAADYAQEELQRTGRGYDFGTLHPASHPPVLPTIPESRSFPSIVGPEPDAEPAAMSPVSTSFR